MQIKADSKVAALREGCGRWWADEDGGCGYCGQM